jgi:hypothetical protein
MNRRCLSDALREIAGQAPGPTSSEDTATIVGAVIGSVAAVALIAAVIAWKTGAFAAGKGDVGTVAVTGIGNPLSAAPDAAKVTIRSV